MRRRLSRPHAVLAAAACATAAMAAMPAVATAAPLAGSHGAAGPVQDPVPIRPNQYFSGYINNHPPGQAIIQTNCIGPTRPGQTGNPLPNQPVEVKPVTPTSAGTDLGYTGGGGRSIVATLATPTGAVSVIATFTSYYVTVDIPTSITVPCYGSGVGTFTPIPTSPTASSATLSVTFEGQP
jgi:hypothetical protein